MHHWVHCSIIYNRQDPETILLPLSRSVDKKAVEHLHHGILFGHKKEGTPTFFNRMDVPKIIMVSEISQSEKVKYHMISLICEM